MLILPWFFLIIELLVFSLIKPYTSNPDFYATLLIAFNIILVLLVFRKYQKNVFLLLFLGFLMRIILMYVDIYSSTSLPHSGNDSVGFYNSAIKISQDLSLIKDNIYGGLYSKVLGVILYFGPVSRIIVQYLNVLLNMFTIIIVYQLMTQLKIKIKIKKTMLLLFVIFPSSLIFSSILLRETFIAFLIVLSFHFFLKWILKGKLNNVFIAVLLILIGATFHSGVIGLIIGYLYMLLFYKPKIKKFKVSLQTVFVFIILLIVYILINIISIENIALFDKFTHLYETNEDLYNIATGGSGGSVYLQNLQITNPILLILISPIKMIYFILSPLPMNWRGILDITSFLFDGLIYGILLLYPIINYRKIIKGDPIAITLVILIISAIFVFGIGINNSGTAMRHRFKFFALIVIFFSYSINKKHKTNSYQYNKFIEEDYREK